MIEKIQTPRLRIFAGPNGSGKSTMKSVLRPELLGIYINPDEIEKDINKNDSLDLDEFGVKTTQQELFDFFNQSTLLEKAALEDEVMNLTYVKNKNSIDFGNVSINSYWASVTADFIRYLLLKNHQSFTFETVMSSPDKVQLLAKAKALGYKTYLYYVATEDPSINIERVKQRVQKGGHNVPEEKTVARYYRSLDLLSDAIKQTNRSYIFDNSKQNLQFLAEINNASEVNIQSEILPHWFQQYIIDKI
jgi:predicted ABC-type ATPase